MSNPKAITWITPKGASRPPGHTRSYDRYLRHAANAAWSPVDAILASRKLSNLVIGVAICGAAAVSVRAGGVPGLIANASALAVIWGATARLIRLGQQQRSQRSRRHVLPGQGPTAVRWQGSKRATDKADASPGLFFA
jgi:hypothetical protein